MADYKHSSAPPMATGYPAGDPYPPPMPGFQPQAPAQWSTGLCDCSDDCGNCCLTWCCPCITFGRIAEIVDRGSSSCGTSGALYALIMAFTGCQCLYSCAYRSKLRAHYALPESPFNDCLVHCCCELCALCQVYRELQNRGFDMTLDYSFECIGDTGAISTALQSCSDAWGLTVTLGVPKANPEVKLHYGLLLSGKTLKGSLLGGWRPKTDLPLLVQKYMEKEIHLEDFVTHDIAFDDINNAFNLMKEGQCLRCVIHMF